MDKKEMLSLMELSADAYLAVQPLCRGENMTFIDDRRSGVQCAVRRAGSTLTIAFRGTDSKADWRSNFRFCKKTIPYDNEASPIRVHEGFLSAYKCDAVRGRLQRMMTPQIRRIRVTGIPGARRWLCCARSICSTTFPTAASRWCSSAARAWATKRSRIHTTAASS